MTLSTHDLTWLDRLTCLKLKKDITIPVATSYKESLILKKEPSNIKDRLPVCVQKEGVIVGHVPRNLAPLFYYLLDRDFNNGFAEVKGMPLNHGAGMGIYQTWGNV